MKWWKFLVTTTWGPRQETLDECAARAKACIENLGRIDPVFASWSFKAPGQEPAPLSIERLKQEFYEGRNIGDDGVTVFEDLGYRLRLHAGTSYTDWAQLSMHCSSYVKGIVNSCILFLPGLDMPVGNSIIDWGKMCEILKVFARTWDVDHGYGKPFHFDGPALDGRHPYVPGVVWMTYLCAARGRIPKLPACYRVVPVDNLGTIVVTTTEIFDQNSPEHLRLAAGLHKILDDEGLLYPTPGSVCEDPLAPSE